VGREAAVETSMTGIWRALGRKGIPFERTVRLDSVNVNAWPPSIAGSRCGPLPCSYAPATL